MKYMKQLGIILAVSFVGEIIKQVIDLPIPASIYGFVLMFLLLQFRIIKEDSVKETGSFLIEIMPLMFIPGAVGILDSWEQMKDSWHIFGFIAMITTVLVMVVAGKVTDRMLKWEEKHESDHR